MARSLSLLGQIGRSITTPASVFREKKYFFAFFNTNVHGISVAIIEMVCNGNGIHQVCTTVTFQTISLTIHLCILACWILRLGAFVCFF
jgi:hypothetical protein